jgi:uncharacterized protein (TIGR02001 family)
MKKIIVTTMAAGMVAAVASAEVSVTSDFASAYVFRGVTLNDGAVVQPGIEASGFQLPEAYGSLTAGVWGNYDVNDYAPAGVSGSSSQETDYYASYGLPTLIKDVSLSVGYCEYSYGTGSGDKELNLGVGYDIAGVSLGATIYKGVGGGIGTSSYYELSASYGMDLTKELSASIDGRAGFADPEGGKSGFHDYDVGAGLSYALTDKWSLGGSVKYIGQGDSAVLADATSSSAGYDVKVVGMLSVGCSM